MRGRLERAGRALRIDAQQRDRGKHDCFVAVRAQQRERVALHPIRPSELGTPQLGGIVHAGKRPACARGQRRAQLVQRSCSERPVAGARKPAELCGPVTTAGDQQLAREQQRARARDPVRRLRGGLLHPARPGDP